MVKRMSAPVASAWLKITESEDPRRTRTGKPTVFVMTPAPPWIWLVLMTTFLWPDQFVPYCSCAIEAVAISTAAAKTEVDIDLYMFSLPFV